MSCNCAQPAQGNAVSGIPVKVGEPLSTANERSYVIGGIPQVTRYPGFTLVNGGLAETKISDAGIANLKSFFKTRTGTYGNENGALGGSNCCA